MDGDGAVEQERETYLKRQQQVDRRTMKVCRCAIGYKWPADRTADNTADSPRQ